MNAPLRILASPYARRLARERGVPLAALAGSGPDGRIVAADIPADIPVPGTAGVPPALPEPPPLPAEAPPPARRAPAAIRAVGAFAATLDLGPLIAFIAASGADLALDCFLIKAAAQAAAGHAEDVLWQDADGPVTVPRAAGSSPTGIARALREGVPEEAGGTPAVPGRRPMALSRLGGTGIRPVGAALPAGVDLRLLVVAAEKATSAEALLVHDADSVPEAAAAALLAAFRDFVEAPLRLLV